MACYCLGHEEGSMDLEFENLSLLDKDLVVHHMNALLSDSDYSGDISEIDKKDLLHELSSYAAPKLIGFGR